jgi:D-beta-D-heptose 7-phosphate kinase/D-beta-D-heptose 1-phosphate adenosyltransferase
MTKGTITTERLKHLLSQFAGKRIMVIGDLMLDEFVWGNVKRISPEAPVPVVEFTEEYCYPGGAANVARNLCEFTRGVSMMGVIGRDNGGERLKDLLRERHIDLSCVQESAAHQTIVKTRIQARQQQIVRVDREKKRPLSPEQKVHAIAQLEERLGELDGVIIEDYGKGFLQQDLVDAFCERIRAAGKIVTVDPNPGNPLKWNGVTAIKPNRGEAFVAAGVPFSDPVSPVENDAALYEVAARLLEKWQSEQLLITLSEQGMLLFQRGAEPYHTPPRARSVFDVSGAGDTTIALFTLALCAGATPVEAAEIANHAGGVVVGKIGTATVNAEELIESFQDAHE